jgi:predicted nucleic acid-binding protein
VRFLVDSDWLIDAAIGSPDPAATLADFREFLGGYAILPLTDTIVERFARVRAALRQQGPLIPDMDLLIAATAI